MATPKSYKPEVQTDDSGIWYDNALRFATPQEAEENVADLFARWTMVRKTRVMPSDDPPNYTYKDGKLEKIT